MLNTRNIFILAIVCALAAGAGCSKSKKYVANKYAIKTIDALDSEYKSELKSPPAKDAGAASYCISLGTSVTTSVESTNAALQGFKSSVGNDAAGRETVMKIEELQQTLKDCAYVRCKTLINDDTATLRKIAGVLGVKIDAAPSTESCTKFENDSAVLKSALGGK